MQDRDLLSLWQNHDQQLSKVVAINQLLVDELIKSKVGRALRGMHGSTWRTFLLGLPWVILLFAISGIGFLAQAWLVAFGFGAIALIMSLVLGRYVYHLYLLQQINRSEEVLEIQKRVATLRLSAFKTIRLSFFQLPFWSVCWMSFNETMASPLLYGGISLGITLLLGWAGWYLYHALSLENPTSWVSKLFLSGGEWDSLQKADTLLREMEAYR